MSNHKKQLFLIILTVLIVGNICFNLLDNDPYNDFNYDNDKTQNLQIQSFSKEDYTPLIENEQQGLGNITVENLVFNEVGFFNNSQKYPSLDDDLGGSLNMTYLGTSFKETKSVAQFDNLADENVKKNILTVVLNESISVQYDSSIPDCEGYLIYATRLYPCKLIQFLMIRKGSGSIEEIPDEDYKIDNFNFLFFNYLDYLETPSNNFTMYLLWELNLTVRDWILYQASEEKLLVDQQEQEVSAQFHYNFSIRCLKFDGDSLTSKVATDNIDIFLKLNPPDKALLYEQQLKVNFTSIEVEDFLNIDNSINISTSGDILPISLDFKANYTVKFVNPVEDSWAIDRLVEDRNIRERIYLPSLTAGPKHILLKYIMIYEKTITFDQVLLNSSLFNRNFPYYDLNITIIEESLKESLIFTENAIKKEGLKIILPFLLVGEIVPFIIRYDANNDLNIKITDNINMPLVDVQIALFYYQKQYGTYISNDLLIPMSPVSTNENGEVTIRNIPNGEYTVMIYKEGKLIKEAMVATDIRTNFVLTNEIHFPSIILIFGAISGIFVLLGFIFHIRYKRY